MSLPTFPWTFFLNPTLCYSVYLLYPSCFSINIFPISFCLSGAVFTGYYQNNPPGVYFSMPVLLSLLQALLKAGMVSDVLSVLSVSLAHKIVVSLVFIHLVTIMSCCSTLCSPVEGRACSVLYEERSTVMVIFRLLITSVGLKRDVELIPIFVPC